MDGWAPGDESSSLLLSGVDSSFDGVLIRTAGGAVYILVFLRGLLIPT